ncbi:hypothetical protein F4679DRAFT_532311 [Xylaria curta]|nr:hypothetical protein F4679DRAFT_532311 [Xylaria curta]
MSQLQSAWSPAEKPIISQEACCKRFKYSSYDIDTNEPVSRYGVNSLVAGEL